MSDYRFEYDCDCVHYFYFFCENSESGGNARNHKIIWFSVTCVIMNFMILRLYTTDCCLPLNLPIHLYVHLGRCLMYMYACRLYIALPFSLTITNALAINWTKSFLWNEMKTWHDLKKSWPFAYINKHTPHEIQLSVKSSSNYCYYSIHIDTYIL